MSLNIQSGTSTIPDSQSTLDVAIASVDLAEAFVLLSSTNATSTTNAGIWMVYGRLTSATNLRLQREFSSGDQIVSWYVIEGLPVQSFTGSMTASETQKDHTITAVDLAAAFAVVSWSVQSNDSRSHRLRVGLTSATNLRVQRAFADGVLNYSAFVVGG